MRSTLEAALVACAETPWRPGARRFLRGLSFDELEYIAEFLGACILESCGPARVAGCFDCRLSEDHALKQIVLLEFLHRAGHAGSAR